MGLFYSRVNSAHHLPRPSALAAAARAGALGRAVGARRRDPARRRARPDGRAAEERPVRRGLRADRRPAPRRRRLGHAGAARRADARLRLGVRALVDSLDRLQRPLALQPRDRRPARSGSCAAGWRAARPATGPCRRFWWRSASARCSRAARASARRWRSRPSCSSASAFEPRLAVLVCLIANTAPVAFGGIGVPIVALAGVTGLDVMKLSAMVGRQLPFLSLILPAYLAWVVDGRRGLGQGLARGARRRPELRHGPVPRLEPVGPLRDRRAQLARVDRRDRRVPQGSGRRGRAAVPRIRRPVAAAAARHPARRSSGWLPWALISVVMIAWSYFKLFPLGQVLLPIPGLHDQVLITLYQKPYAAIFTLPAARRRDGRAGDGAAHRPRVPRQPARAAEVRPRGAEAAARARAGGAAHRLALVSLQLLRDGVHARRRPGGHGLPLSVRQRLPRVGRLLPERQRHLEQPALRQPAGGGRASAGSESRCCWRRRTRRAAWRAR